MARRANLEGRVRAVGRGGDGVVETVEGVVLVPGVLPGERVEIERRASKRGARRGSLVRILEPSPERVVPRCPEVTRCGGCPLMAASVDLQRDIKLGHLWEACHGLRGSESLELEWIPSGKTFGYRRRARLSWHGDSFGYRQLGTRRVTDVARCLVVEPSLQAAWDDARAELRGILSGSGDIRLERSGADRVVVGMSTSDPQSPEVFGACGALNRAEAIAGVTLRTEADVAPATWGDTTIRLETDQRSLTAPPSSFVQANDRVNQSLVEHVVRLAEPKGLRVLELHCGVGNFTVPLAAASPSALVAVEQEPDAVEACRRNLAEHGLGARVTLGDANMPPKGHYDVVVLDPPRQGARALFEDSDFVPGPKRIVYVSCDTATLQRDLHLATDAGYRIDVAIGFDMFPQTAHLESLVRLVRD